MAKHLSPTLQPGR